MNINDFFDDDDVIEAHKQCFENRDSILKSYYCGCFYCCTVFRSNMIKKNNWINDKNDKTALCPFCGIDSVIGDYSDYPITEEFMQAMKKRWF